MPDKAPSVAVVIPTYNRADTVVRAVESALSQTLPPAEVIVVDDGSTDHPERALEGYPVRIVRKSNGGGASALNAGVRVASSDFVARLDSDDHYRPDFLRSCVETAERTGAGIVGTDAIVQDVGGAITRTRYFDQPFPVRRERQRVEILRRNLLLGASVYRTNVVRMLNGWDEDRRLEGAVDYDLMLRAVGAGVLLGFVEQPHYVLCTHPGQASANRLWSLRARTEVLDKYQVNGAAGAIDLARTERAIRFAERAINAYRVGSFLGVRAGVGVPRAAVLWWATQPQFARRRLALMAIGLAPGTTTRRLRSRLADVPSG